MTDTPKSDDTYSEEETVMRREATLKRMLATPHKPHKLGGKAEANPPRRSREKHNQPD
jgi:hypothetical protein